jgi:hypothetical protein
MGKPRMENNVFFVATLIVLSKHFSQPMFTKDDDQK